ncbi:MAG TPA: hypothetical protein PLR60_13170 [Syntrophorhabdaceae bacterium]|nr:hypothetical protein [Syntrophorhabdaceae bacterium]
MIRTIKFLVLLLFLTAVSEPVATAGSVICECPSKRCFSAGQWWPYCPECVCSATTATYGPEPYTQPVDSSFLKNNFNIDYNNLMQFIRDAFEPPLTQKQISDLLGQAGQATSDGLPTYEIRSLYEPSYQYSMLEIKYDTIKLSDNALDRKLLEAALKNVGKVETIFGPMDMNLLAAAAAAAQHGLSKEDMGLADKVFDRFKEKMQALEQIFPNAMKNLDDATTAKLYQDAVNEVKAGEELRKNLDDVYGGSLPE